MRVLIVEDDVKLAGLIQRALREQAALADVAHEGEDALWMADATPYDVIVLDLNLPGIDGFETCRRLRSSQVPTPILMLTARASVTDRVTGLDTGADDYLVKPFDVSELLARIRALARRGPVTRGPVLSADDLSLDPGTQVVRRGSTPISLSTKEFQLLEVLMRRPGQVLSRYDLLEGAWDMAYENKSNVIDFYIRYLRNKIDRPFGMRTIETVRGAGYRLAAAARLRPLGYARGSAMQASAPPSGGLPTAAAPPCAIAMAATRDSPSPLPGSRARLPRVNRWNARSAMSSAKPLPWSATCSPTSSPSSRTVSVIVPAPYRSALAMRLSSACATRSGSPSSQAPGAASRTTIRRPLVQAAARARVAAAASSAHGSSGRGRSGSRPWSACASSSMSSARRHTRRISSAADLSAARSSLTSRSPSNASSTSVRSAVSGVRSS